MRFSFLGVLRSLFLAGAVLGAGAASAASGHFWTYAVNGRYGYVDATAVNACAGQSWQTCGRPILWYAYGGTATLARVRASHPALAQYIATQYGDASLNDADTYIVFVSLSPDPNHALTGQGDAAVHDWLVFQQPFDPLKMRVPAHQVLTLHVHADGSMTGHVHAIDRNSAASRVFRDIEFGQLQIRQPTSSDQAEAKAARAQAQLHPAPAHWWMYDVKGRYGFVEDSADPTCTANWRDCTKGIFWMMYDGQQPNGDQVFTVFDSPTALKVLHGQASPLHLNEQPNGQVTFSFYATDGSSASQPIQVDAHTAVWFAMQDAQRGQLVPSQLTAADLAPLQGARQQFEQARGALLRGALQSWIDQPRVELDNR